MWWIGPVVAIVWLFVFPLGRLIDGTAAVIPIVFLLFYSGFVYAQRLRQLGRQSKVPAFRIPNESEKG